MPEPELKLTTIGDVLAELDRIVEQTREENSPKGIFAWVYRRTTAKIMEAIEEGRFEDPDRMERFDPAFARYYIDAYRRHRRGDPVPLSWQVAFDEAESRESLIIQHLVLAMNAHINYDLGIAAARFAPKEHISSFKIDFLLVNTLFGELTEETQQRVSRVSPLMFLLDWLGQRTDEVIINFSIAKAREHAWNIAQNLAYAEEEEREAMIQEVDEEISGLGNLVAHPPGFLLPKVLSVIRFFEEKNVRRVIEKLKR